jgi:hypothetical protein
MKKLKNFFSPVKGGVLDGYTFSQFVSSPQRWLPILINLGFITVVLIESREAPIDGMLLVISFLVTILLVVIFKNLQKWNDLKNHTSR